MVFERSNRVSTDAKFLVFACLALGTTTGLAADSGRSDSALEDEFAVGSQQAYHYPGLEENIEDLGRSVINATTRHSTQSDDVDITQHEITADFFFADGTHRLSPGVLDVEYDPDTAVAVKQRSAGITGSYRISDGAAITGAFWLNRLSASDMPTDNISTYDFYVTLWPSDLLRFDIDVKREIFDNTTSLRMGIAMRSVGVSMDVHPTDLLRLSLRGARGDINDGNDKWSAEAEAVWKVKPTPAVEMGLRVSGFEFSEQFNNGYFNPEKYQSAEAMLRVRSSLSEKVVAELGLSGGVENSNPGDSKGVYKGSLQLSGNLSRNWILDGGIAYFSSRQSNSSGFARTSFKLGIHYKL